MLLLLFRFLARWPLPLLHALGWGLGWLTWLASPTYRRRWAENTRRAGVTGPERWAAVGEAGKQVAELPRLWFGPAVPVRWQGAEHVEQTLARSHGVLMLTPHLGCFEVVAQAYAERFGLGENAKPMTALYRPPRQAAWRAVVEQARQRPGLLTAPTTLAGVKQLLQALKKGQTVGLLPDQVPPDGQGVWAPFFGEPAYTMTLSSRLAQVGGTEVLLLWGERLPWGRGYVVHVQPWAELMPEPVDADPVRAATQVNKIMERLVSGCPRQYLWGYARYKSPRQAA
ncbi:MAG TPA: lysophospholipid acyltransferase family protein [Macromonas sp.]|nr:lysophospholipid acyltransferase family protein [Macromonas sp.]